MQERIQKIIAQSGLCSRRKAEELIINGKVKVNGIIANIGEQANNKTDEILVNGTKLKKEKKIYLMLNKPKGVVCTLERQGKQKIITDIIKTKERIFPVGRLDKDTTGLLLLTNDGNFTNEITHPSKEIIKTYYAVLDKNLTEKDKQKIKQGIKIDDRKVEIKKIESEANKTKITLHEGRKHIVKRIFENKGYEVIELERISINNLKLDLKIGQYRELTKKDFEKLGFKQL